MIQTILRIFYLRLRNNPLELMLVFVMPVIFFSMIDLGGLITGRSMIEEWLEESLPLRSSKT